MNNEMLILTTACASVVTGVYFVITLVFGSDDGRLRSRLLGKAKQSEVDKKAQPKGMATIVQQIGQAASAPFMPKSREKQSNLQAQLGRAGIYSQAAVRSVQGAKLISLSLGLILGYVLNLWMGDFFLVLSLGGLIGYLTPRLVLALKVKANQKAMEHGLPDALDLMVVCVEAGLTVDAAMQRIGEELALVHPALSREFGITHMQTRVGLARQEALRNMGQRTGNASILSLAAMLNQADRFGTSIAQALRVHAESMRIARQHKAEEMASKSTVKMSFPLVLFIFPATFIVLMGPVIIQLFDSPLMK
jgi:tight adherence protein C